jgi:hypothetical protein
MVVGPREHGLHEAAFGVAVDARGEQEVDEDHLGGEAHGRLVRLGELVLELLLERAPAEVWARDEQAV